MSSRRPRLLALSSLAALLLGLGIFMMLDSFGEQFAVMSYAGLFGAPASAQTAPPADAQNPPPSQTAPQNQTPPPKETTTPAKADAAVEGTPATVLDGEQAHGILGRQVRSNAGEDMGRIVDIVVDNAGKVRAAVVDFGGFLGVGSRQIAVAWTALRFPAESKSGAIAVDLTRDQLRVAPAYKANEQIVLLGRPDANQNTNQNTPASNGPPPEKESSPK